MRQIYSHLLTFTFRHRYFRDNQFRSASINFAEASAKLITDLDIVVKPFPGGLNLLSSAPELLEGEMRPIRLYLNCNDPLYINYSELPSFQPANNLLYFNNLNINSTSDVRSFLLHSEEFVGKNEVVSLTHGKITTTAPDQIKQYQLTDAAGGEISASNIKFPTNNTGELTLYDLPEGLVSLLAAGKEVRKVYHQPNPIWVKPMGIVEIYPGELFNQYKKGGKVEYAIQFSTRQTIWKYFVVSPIYQKFNNLSIINKGKEQIFSAPQKQHVLQNPEALVFESKSEIPLLELSDEIYQLVDNYDPNLPSGRIILKNLAKASPEQLYCDTTKSDAPVYSHIYI